MPRPVMVVLVVVVLAFAASFFIPHDEQASKKPEDHFVVQGVKNLLVPRPSFSSADIQCTPQDAFDGQSFTLTATIPECKVIIAESKAELRDWRLVVQSGGPIELKYHSIKPTFDVEKTLATGEVLKIQVFKKGGDFSIRRPAATDSATRITLGTD